MFNKNLVQWCTVDIHPTVCGLKCSECKHEQSAHVCPHCSSQLRYGCVLNIKTVSIELVWMCYDCGHTE